MGGYLYSMDMKRYSEISQSFERKKAAYAELVRNRSDFLFNYLCSAYPATVALWPNAKNTSLFNISEMKKFIEITQKGMSDGSMSPDASKVVIKDLLARAGLAVQAQLERERLIFDWALSQIPEKDRLPMLKAAPELFNVKEPLTEKDISDMAEMEAAFIIAKIEAEIRELRTPSPKLQAQIDKAEKKKRRW